jgi:hypothetical protein
MLSDTHSKELDRLESVVSDGGTLRSKDRAILRISLYRGNPSNEERRRIEHLFTPPASS